MPNKPDKFGIKFWVLTDVDSKYVVNIIPYLGAQDQSSRDVFPVAMSVVLNLTDCIKGKGYNITCDNSFTSLKLAKILSERNTSIVGTIRRSQRELCPLMTEPQKGNVLESRLF